jgi:hypothetical protein
MRLLIAALLLLPLSVPTAIAADGVRPFHARYTTARNGDELGWTTLDLRDNGDGTWTLRTETRGTRGLARLAGVHVVETSVFRWRGGRPEALTYDFRQRGALRQRTRHAEFDWKAGEVRVSEGGHDYRYPTTPGLVDRQTVTLALAADLAHGRKTFEYAVAVKDRVERRRYEHGPRESLVVPAGTFEGLLMRRTDDVGPGRSRIARSWFAPALGWLPVQIEQVETKKDEVISLKLVEAPAPAAGSSRAGLAPRP